MSAKEAKARIKINNLLEEAGWRFLDSSKGKANVLLENHVKITQAAMDAFGNDFEKTKSGFIDFLLLDEKGFPLIVLEAKSEDKNPLVGKEQARKYAISQKCRFVILSNGNLHYFWDLERGNPNVITQFPEPSSVKNFKERKPDTGKLINEPVDKDYVAITQYPDYKSDPQWQDLKTQPEFVEKHGLKFLRKYQIQAVQSIQKSVSESKERFLFEMATGTGKTLVAAAVIKLFLRTGNASRVLFLVDRLELEDQANKAFIRYLKNDYTSVIYKENRDDWRRAEIVVTTVQSLLFNNKFMRLFSPTDFDLVISDEAHRSIGGNSRAVFEYFIGYKLGLTATPKDYLKKIDQAKLNSKDPRELERRMMLDSYRTFGCESGKPTFRYSLIDGVNDGFLINPVVADARTDITTELLSEAGYSILVTTDEGEETEETFFQRDFEKKFYSEKTNRVFCKTFLENALRDPISHEIGKSIIFTVSQIHAAKITQVLNEMADQLFPGKYQSDFAIQVTSSVSDAQQFTINFTNNNLNGSGNMLDSYKTSKSRVCVTVGMMTTGYDCPDILNLGMMRPIFSPTDFIQIKGRGTRKHNFLEELFDKELKNQLVESQKTKFKLFDFFANCEYFEDKFDYDEILKLPLLKKSGGEGGGSGGYDIDEFESFDPDKLATMQETSIGAHGMKIDRMFFQEFGDKVRKDSKVMELIDQGHWEKVLDHISQLYLDKPEEYYTVEKLRKAAKVDRKLSLREIVEHIFGLIPHFKSKDELLNEEFEKFITDYKPEDTDDIIALKYFFKAYVSDEGIRDIVDKRQFAKLHTNPKFSINDYKAVKDKWRTIIPDYIRNYVPVHKFVA